MYTAELNPITYLSHYPLIPVRYCSIYFVDYPAAFIKRRLKNVVPLKETNLLVYNVQRERQLSYSIEGELNLFWKVDKTKINSNRIR